MKITKIALLILLSVSYHKMLSAQDSLFIYTYPSMKEIDPFVEVVVDKENDLYLYQYTIRNAISSKQEIWTLSIQALGDIQNVESPFGWSGLKLRNISRVSFGADEEDFFLEPGGELTGLNYISNYLPGVSYYLCAGWVEIEPLDVEPDSIIGNNIFENSKIGKTLGPKDPPDPFIALTFLDTLASYKHQAFDLGWIDNQGIANSLDQKLENAKKQLEKGKNKQALNMLNAFLNEVEAQKDKHLTSEAYALLKYNAEYLIQRLEED